MAPSHPIILVRFAQLVVKCARIILYAIPHCCTLLWSWWAWKRFVSVRLFRFRYERTLNRACNKRLVFTLSYGLAEILISCQTNRRIEWRNVCVCGRDRRVSKNSRREICMCERLDERVKVDGIKLIFYETNRKASVRWSGNMKTRKFV